MINQKYKLDLDKLYYWIGIFLISSVLLFFILPGKPKFQFEYQKGFPWKHRNLVAPFDFAVMKSQAEIDAEKKAVMEVVAPYFIKDTMVEKSRLSNFANDWERLVKPNLKEQETLLKSITEMLTAFYSNGILLHSPEMYKELTQKKEINRRIGNEVSKINISNLNSEKTAYFKLSELLEQLGEKCPGAKQVLVHLSPEKYIAANLIFDSETTRKSEEEAVRKISLTRGMVQSGEKIIMEGEIIDDVKFQILESLKSSYQTDNKKSLTSSLTSFGKMGLIMILLGLIFAFLYNYRRDVLNHPNKLIFLFFFITFTVLIASIINAIPGLHIYIFPLAIFPIVVRNFFDSRTAIFTLIITSILIAFHAPNNYEYVLLQFSAGVVAVFSLNHMHRRVHVVIATLWIFGAYVAVYTALNLLREGKLAFDFWIMIERFVISSVLILLVYPLVYIFEKLFGFISDVTLIEISDTNQPLLRKLAEEAPGTFQHSMQIAILAEEVILKIGGNPFLVRAGALYHDIGKIAKPDFFIENQAYGMNPHDKIDNLRSAEIIIDHVENGQRMAKKFNIPEALIEFIITHHGTSKTKYFFVKYLKENPEAQIDEKLFQYPGPLPKSKEATVVMLVDGIEAASRALKDKTAENFKELVDRMIEQKISDRQLENSEITFRDIKTIKETLLKKLMNIYHVRIEYPKE